MVKSTYFLFLLFLISSCAVLDIDYHMPMTKFDTSETIGSEILENSEYKFQVQAGIGATHKVTLAEVIDPIIFNETVNDKSSIDSSVHLNSAATIGIIPRLDISLRVGIDTPPIFGAKFQFLGSGEVKRKEGWSGSIVMKAGGGEKDEGRLTTRNSTSSDVRTYSAKVDFKTYESSLIFGHRINRSTLFYFNNFYTYYDVTGDLTSTTLASVNVNGISRQYGSLIGGKFHSKNNVFLIIEGGLVKATWENQASSTDGAYGLSLGLNF
tara:strand:- start:38177 stop:38977 length:801 start_codon:yes stop_codon:yes gene_type:complete